MYMYKKILLGIQYCNPILVSLACSNSGADQEMEARWSWIMKEKEVEKVGQ